MSCVRLHLGDSAEILKSYPDNSIDSIIQDPPAWIGFMGLDFDKESEYQNFLPVLEQCFRVLKPGGHMLVWALPRTSWMTGYAINAAGFECRDIVSHLFGCLSDDTELLTDHGWERYDKITTQNLALCYDPVKREYGWNSIDGIFVYENAHSCFRITGDATDQIVTGCHRILIEREGDFVCTTAGEAAQEPEVRVPVLENLPGLLQHLSCTIKGARSFTQQQFSDQSHAFCIEQGPQKLRVAWDTPTNLVRIEPIRYVGKVWCIKVPTGFFVARRAGKVFVTGNSGFPKSHNIAKAIQKESSVEPIGELPPSLGMANNPQWNDLNRQLIMPEPEGVAAEWEGWGTALKPAREDWILARKPISETTVAKNVLKHGTGAINIDASRIGSNAGWSYPNGRVGEGCFGRDSLSENLDTPMSATKGRFPANVLLSHSDGCTLVGVSQVKSGKAVRSKSGGKNIHSKVEKPAMDDMSYGDADGNETIEKWECVEGCAVRLLNEQTSHLKGGIAVEENRSGEWSGNTTYAPRKSVKRENQGYGDGGGASRFFYCAKPAKKEKEAGCSSLPKKTAAELTGRKEGSAGLVAKHVDGSDKANPYAGTSGAEPRANTHPTVKAVTLMTYLIKMITPPGGTVLDAYMGSGSTGVAAVQAGFNFVGIEKSPEYYEIAKARIDHASST